MGQPLKDDRPLAQQVQHLPPLPQAPDHPGCVHGTQEASGTACPCGPEGLREGGREGGKAGESRSVISVHVFVHD